MQFKVYFTSNGVHFLLAQSFRDILLFRSPFYFFSFFFFHCFSPFNRIFSQSESHARARDIFAFTSFFEADYIVHVPLSKSSEVHSSVTIATFPLSFEELIKKQVPLGLWMMQSFSNSFIPPLFS